MCDPVWFFLVENNVLRFNIHVTRKLDAHVHICN